MSTLFRPGLLVCLLASGAAAEEEPENVLVHYDFEDDDIETGPYTLWVFEGAKGAVSLSSTFRYRGYRSVEIRDAAGDGRFTELQGFFPDKWSGRLYIHFAILVAEPRETLNIAFAGISHFYLREHGLAIWFKTNRGVLYHVTGARDEPLFQVEPFAWYVFDLVYDVDRGLYDLIITAEGRDEPVVALQDQVNAVGIPGSQLRKYSFVGDVPGSDSSNAWYYVDDILITNDVPVSETPFVAPGRRMLFIDIHDRYQARLYERPGCVPVVGYEDFDLGSQDIMELGAIGARSLLEQVLEEDEVTLPRELSSFLRQRLLAIRDWREACGNRGEALELFRRAQQRVPGAKIYPMSEVLALVGQRRWQEADALLLSIYSLWQDDPRFPAISASVGLARGDLEYAEQWLASSPETVPKRLRHPAVRKLWSGNIGPGLVDELQAEFPSEWPDLVRAALTADLRFYVLLWQKRYDEALSYAERLGALFQRMELPLGRWLERRGDAAFYAGDYLEAQRRYEESLKHRTNPDPVLLRLSDTHFMLGNLDLERFYREKIYGSLRPE